MIDDVTHALKFRFPDGEYDTFGGFVFAIYGSIVADGRTFELDYENLHINVLEIKDHRIEKTLVVVNNPPAQAEEQN